jgi:hypothetical protein
VLRILVDRRLSGDPSMVEELVVRRRDVSPISYRRSESGYRTVELAYHDGLVTGWHEVDGDVMPINSVPAAAVWDGNVLDPLIAALPAGTHSIRLYYQRGSKDVRIEVADAGSGNTVAVRHVNVPADGAASQKFDLDPATRRELGRTSDDGISWTQVDCSEFDDAMR